MLTDAPMLKTIVDSFRDWGRHCWCEPGFDNICAKRCPWQFGALPPGYDHKYVYTHAGYNLKLTDMQAAIGVAQLHKLASFVEARRRNWTLLREALAGLEEYFILPRATEHADPSWFGFAITLREGAPFIRNALVESVESRRIAARLLFAGNLTRQPAFKGVDYRVAGELTNTDAVMNRTLWVGVYPGLTAPMMEWITESRHQFVAQSSRVSTMAVL